MKLVGALLTVLMVSLPADADVKLPKIFTDHMVLQQGLTIPVWGWADPGEKVTVSFNGRVAKTKARADRSWKLSLEAMKSDGKAHLLVVEGKNAIKLKDVVLGEVWLCSGQSNMGRPVSGKQIDSAMFPRIRLFHVDGKTPRDGDLDSTVGWLVCSPEALRRSGDGNEQKRRPFSEVAFVFGRHLHEKLGVPVGIIQSNTGGSTAKDWTPLPNARKVFPLGSQIERLKHTPGACFDVKLRGLIPFSIRGVVWYQGEDDGRNRQYSDDLVKLISSWRRLWNRKDLPFYQAQIAQTTYASGMLGVWEAQAKIAREIPHTALAPSNDLQDRSLRTDEGNPKQKIAGTGWPIVAGSNPHPPNKHIVAKRLADIALAKTYGKLEREVCGPTYLSHEIRGNKLVVKFGNVGEGLSSEDDKMLTWFELSEGEALDDRPKSRIRYVKAVAKIVGKDSVEISAAEISNPKFVRFSWHPLARHNLINREGLPAIPFRSDQLPQMWNRR